MRILDGLITALRNIIGDAKEDVGEIKEHIDERRNERLAERLDQAAAPRKLNWRNSVVDLLTTVEMDSSLEARKRLAAEMNFKGNFTGSASDNIWLHGAVLDALKEHDICLPKRSA